MQSGDPATASAAADGTRPSLFNPARPAAETPRGGATISILSSLDGGAGKRPSRSATGLPTWLTIAVGTLLVIAIAVAIAFGLARDTGLHPPSAEPVVVARAEVSEPAPAPLAAPAGKQIDLGATVENAPPAASTAVPVQAVAQPASAIETAPTSQSTSAPTAPAAATKNPEAVPASAAATTPAAHHEDRTHEAQAGPTAPKSATANDAKPAKTAAAADRDASLIAALVAYGEGRPASEINANTAAIASQPPKPTAGPTPAQSAQFDPKRDVVMRAPTLTTGELVRRCRTLGFVEGMLCRNRVCANQWGKDAACPQAAAPALRSTD